MAAGSSARYWHSCGVSETRQCTPELSEGPNGLEKAKRYRIREDREGGDEKMWHETVECDFEDRGSRDEETCD